MIAKLKSSLTSLYERVVCRCTPCCHEMTRLISEANERPLGPFTRMQMKLHYGVCIWCVRYRDQIAMIRALIRNFPGTADDGEAMLSEAARERIKETLREAGEEEVRES